MTKPIDDEKIEHCIPVFDRNDLEGFTEALQRFERARNLKDQYDAAQEMESYLSGAHDNAEELEKVLKAEYERSPTKIIDNLYKAVKSAAQSASSLEATEVSNDDRERLRALAWHINSLLVSLLPETKAE
jgi:flagellar hook-associated protein FlgK